MDWLLQISDQTLTEDKLGYAIEKSHSAGGIHFLGWNQVCTNGQWCPFLRSCRAHYV